jgi:hypothetical protein
MTYEMNITELSLEQKTKLLAELDGSYFIDDSWAESLKQRKLTEWIKSQKPYLTSYDAIIPLIQKLNFADIVDDQLLTLFNIEWPLSATASQLCDAVLIATGKAEL